MNSLDEFPNVVNILNHLGLVIAEKKAMTLSKSPYIVHLYYMLQTVDSVRLVRDSLSRSLERLV